MKPYLPLAAALAAMPGLALATTLSVGMPLGKTALDVHSGLIALGYDVRKIETEDGKIEAYAVKDKQMAEVYVDPATGTVAKIKSKSK